VIPIFPTLATAAARRGMYGIIAIHYAQGGLRETFSCKAFPLPTPLFSQGKGEGGTKVFL